MNARRSVQRRVSVIVGSTLLLAVMTGPVLASSGVSVDLGRIQITEELLPGGSYSLPPIGVRNPGTERTSYVMVASAVGDGSAQLAEADWFRYEPPTLTLEPGETRRVNVRLVLPVDSPPGDYTVLVGAQIATADAGASVGAAAAARTTFTIRAAGTAEATLTQLGQWFEDLLPWSVIVPGLVVLTMTVWLLRRRFTFRIGIERR